MLLTLGSLGKDREFACGAENSMHLQPVNWSVVVTFACSRSGLYCPQCEVDCASLVVLCNEWVILCNAGVVLYNDEVVLCNVFLPCSIRRYSVIPLSQNSGLIGWLPHSDTLHTLIRDYRESNDNVERGAQAHVAGGDGRGTLEGEGEGVDEDE